VTARHTIVNTTDTACLDGLGGDTIAVEIVHGHGQRELRFTLAAATMIPLRRMLPALQSMDLEVLHEHTVSTTRADGRLCFVYDLVLEAGTDAAAGLDRDPDDIHRQIRETFHAVWSGRADADGYNALTLAAGLSWRQVCVLRSYGRYLRQTLLPYGQLSIQRALLDNPAATRALVVLFDARFGTPGRAARSPQRHAAITAADLAVTAEIDRVVHIESDRILRAYRNLINATVRTNAFAPEALGPTAKYLVHKLDARNVEELPHPRPLSEIVVHSPDFEGVHMRYGLVARGGLRWSDRHDDYRTEALGLIKTQAVKNAVIVPAGAKGVFVVKATPHNAARGNDPHSVRTNALRCYTQFVSALLDVVDNTAPGAEPASHGVVSHDGPDPYLVVAADKGTATFSDTANAVAMRRGYWLGDAFASGGSAGYDHKAMGITARGAWVSGDSHLRELGIDTRSDEFTVVGIGDMSGDVFGNGMLLRSGIRLVAAFDHRHVFVDPQPRTAAARTERQRLFDQDRSSWDDYDRNVISPGGGVWPRTVKTIPVSAQMRDVLGIAAPAAGLTPDELIRHILRAPVDVLFNGGIGTYIKARHEQHAAVADKTNDGVRVDADQVRARVIVEGGNLGLSTYGRIEFAQRGGLLNTDAIDNAAGVDCSDHEVNIKIVVDAAIGDDVAHRQRGDLLAAMTDDVARHVLANNLAHNRLLSDARSNAAQMLDVHARMTTALEKQGELNRELTGLPTAKQFAERAKAGSGLTAPQLAMLMAHTKLSLKGDLLATDEFDDPYFDTQLRSYFPTLLRRRLEGRLNSHPLRREILATTVVNRMLATSGMTYAFRLAEETGATTGDIVRTHAIVSQVFDLDTLWSEIFAAELPPARTNSLIIEARRLLDRASRWFLLNRPQPLSIEAEVGRFAQPVATLRGTLSAMLCGTERAAVADAHTALVAHGVPRTVASTISESLYAFSLLDIVDAADAHGEDTTALAQVYFHLSAHLGVDQLLLAVSTLPRGDRWHALARLALREDLYRSLRDVAIDVCRRVGAPTELTDITEEFETYSRARITRSRRTLTEVHGVDAPDLAVLSVATAQLRGLVTVKG